MESCLLAHYLSKFFPYPSLVQGPLSVPVSAHADLPWISSRLYMFFGSFLNFLTFFCCRIVQLRVYSANVCMAFLHIHSHFDGLMQGCGISSALALEVPQSCIKPSIYLFLTIFTPCILMCAWSSLHEVGNKGYFAWRYAGWEIIQLIYGLDNDIRFLGRFTEKKDLLVIMIVF